MYSFNVIHYKLNKPYKSPCLAHLSSFESIFIHYNIFWVSFTLDIVFFLTCFSTYFSIGTLPFSLHYTLMKSYHLQPIIMQIDMQLVIVCNYIGYVCNYKFGTIYFLSHIVVCVTNMQLNVYNMDTCHKNNDLNLIFI
jgi:hypothetical protein